MTKPFSMHSHYCNIIRRILKASFVGWVQEADKQFLRIIVNKTEHLMPLEGGELNEEIYKRLINELLSKNEEV